MGSREHDRFKGDDALRSFIECFENEVPQSEDQPSWEEFRRTHGMKLRRWSTYEEVAFGRMSLDDAVSRFMSDAQKALT